MKNSLINSLIYSKVTRSPQSVFEKSFPQSEPDFFTMSAMRDTSVQISSVPTRFFILFIPISNVEVL